MFDKNGLTPTQVALQHGYIDIVRFMLVMAINAEKKNTAKLPSYISKQGLRFKTALDLLEQQTDEAKTVKSNSYHLAIMLNQIDALQLLSVREG